MNKNKLAAILFSTLIVASCGGSDSVNMFDTISQLNDLSLNAVTALTTVITVAR
jgi:hypothetical protein